MNCAGEETLKAMLDGELPEAESKELEAHIASCQACRGRLNEIRTQAKETSEALGTLETAGDESRIDARAAYARLAARAIEERATPRPGWRGASVLGVLRPGLWATLAAAVLLAVVFTAFAPARTWAQRVLEMLRVRQVAVVPVDPALLPMGQNSSPMARMIQELISNDVTVTLKPGPPVKAKSAAEASAMAGFPVRLLTNQPGPPAIRVIGEHAANLVIDRNRVQAILDSAGRPDLKIPRSVDGITIALHVPKAVFVQYGTCPEGRPQAPLRGPGYEQPKGAPQDYSACVTVAEAPSPIVSVPPGLNLSELAELGLQFTGMTQEQAAEFCRTVDWTSTLVVPVPRKASSYSTVEVDGVKGELVTYPVWHQQGYTLIWVKNGIVYAISGFGGPASAPALAASLE